CSGGGQHRDEETRRNPGNDRHPATCHLFSHWISLVPRWISPAPSPPVRRTNGASSSVLTLRAPVDQLSARALNLFVPPSHVVVGEPRAKASQPLPRNRLVERVPPVGRRDAGFQLGDARGAADAVGHDDRAASSAD